MAGERPVPYPVAARQLLRATLLDAMHDAVRTQAWGAVRMADVARAAGVSRQTLYKEFGSRQGFAQAYVLRETDRFLAAVEDAVRAHPGDLRAALAAAFAVFLAAAAEEPLLRDVTSGEGGAAGELLPLVTTQGEPVLARATSRLAAILAAGRDLGEADALLLAEAVVRLAISVAALPSALTPDDLARLLAPFAG